MTIEYIPSPAQLKALLMTGVIKKWSKSPSHRFYRVYIEDEVAEFTAGILGVPHAGGLNQRNNIQGLIDVCKEWDNNLIYTEFKHWAEHYNKQPGTTRQL